MFFKYTNKLFENLKKYDKKATNPFLQREFGFNNTPKSLYEKTYIWVEKNKDWLKRFHYTDWNAIKILLNKKIRV